MAELESLSAARSPALSTVKWHWQAGLRGANRSFCDCGASRHSLAMLGITDVAFFTSATFFSAWE
jgi:hypothetical protein